MKEHCRLSKLLRQKSVVGSSWEIGGSLDTLLCDWEFIGCILRVQIWSCPQKLNCPCQLSPLVAKRGLQSPCPHLLYRTKPCMCLEIIVYLLGSKTRGESSDPWDLDESVLLDSRLGMNRQSNSCYKVRALCCILQGLLGCLSNWLFQDSVMGCREGMQEGGKAKWCLGALLMFF